MYDGSSKLIQIQIGPITCPIVPIIASVARGQLYEPSKTYLAARSDAFGGGQGAIKLSRRMSLTCVPRDPHRRYCVDWRHSLTPMKKMSRCLQVKTVIYMCAITGRAVTYTHTLSARYLTLAPA